MSDPSSAHKPKYLTDAQKRNVEMGPGGWVRKAGDAETGADDANADPEILVAFRGQATITGWISQFRWTTASPSEAAPSALSITAYFSENVDITGTPRIVVTNSQAGGGTAATFNLDYASGTGTDVIVFTSAVPSAGDYAEDDVLSIGANALTLNGGTIKDVGVATVTTITHGAGEGNTGNAATGGTNDGATVTVLA